MSAEPYEGGHHACSEHYRHLSTYPLKHWPQDSGGRHLREYRDMIGVWDQIGRKTNLTLFEAKRIVLCLRSIK
jgi:hypothetical protein